MILTLLISLILLSSCFVPEDSAALQEDINVPEIIFSHIGDEYEWHILEWKGKPVAIPLPCIVIEDGVHVFTLHHAAENG